MDDNEKVFGHYLSAIAERDVDLLLLEELHVSTEFLGWFCSKLGLEQAEFRGAWHSISDTDGETDLLLLIESGNERIGILIENKVGAAEQDAQAERYHVRGTSAQNAGKFDRFVTCICAPQGYLANLDPDSPYQYRLSYEDISAWFGTQSNTRSAWKKRIVEQAIAQHRRGYTMAVNKIATQFHSDYWEYRRQNHPELFMNKPGPKGPRSTWIILKGAGFPRGVHIDHKLDHSLVELGFDGRTVLDLKGAGIDWPAGIVPDQKGGTAVLSVNVSEVRMELGVASQKDALEEAFMTMKRLLPFANIFQEKSR